jgi:hypothetical protein
LYARIEEHFTFSVDPERHSMRRRVLKKVKTLICRATWRLPGQGDALLFSIITSETIWQLVVKRATAALGLNLSGGNTYSQAFISLMAVMIGHNILRTIITKSIRQS